MIDIKGLDKARVLCVLYNGSKPQGMGYLDYTKGELSVEEARSLLEACSNFDYLRGRVMKIDLSRDVLDTRLYNRDNGPNAAERLIEQAFPVR